MPLSCYCGDDYEWYFEMPPEFGPLNTKRSRRCSSCKKRIPVGTSCYRFHCWRHPRTDVEERIFGCGGEVGMAPQHLCETCGDLFESLNELGFCVSIDESMPELAREYAETYGRSNGPAQ